MLVILVLGRRSPNKVLFNSTRKRMMRCCSDLHGCWVLWSRSWLFTPSCFSQQLLCTLAATLHLANAIGFAQCPISIPSAVFLFCLFWFSSFPKLVDLINVRGLRGRSKLAKQGNQTDASTSPSPSKIPPLQLAANPTLCTPMSAMPTSPRPAASKIRNIQHNHRIVFLTNSPKVQ
jgi:hypothetical protein